MTGVAGLPPAAFALHKHLCLGGAFPNVSSRRVVRDDGRDHVLVFPKRSLQALSVPGQMPRSWFWLVGFWFAFMPL